MIVSGLVDPQSESADVSEQYALAAKACCSLARTFLLGGYDVIIDDFETPSGFSINWAPYLSGMEWSVVVIRPSLKETVNRNMLRKKTVKRDIIEKQHSDAGLWSSEVLVDTTGLTVEASLLKVNEVLDLKG